MAQMETPEKRKKLEGSQGENWWRKEILNQSHDSGNLKASMLNALWCPGLNTGIGKTDQVWNCIIANMPAFMSQF